ncbi:MAG: type 1 glutamine amidotransferase [Bdellovibrionales bacterium]|nr:type 1 glutamine amidotransferase [Bdellovibrionales bacterium]
MIRIGISSCSFYGDSQRPIFKGKTLHYFLQPLSDWLHQQGVLAYPIPSFKQDSPIQAQDYTKDLDGLILQGGSDVSPTNYQESPIQPEWSGDFIRDQYEIALIQEFKARKKPILGVCRGLQILNVAFGGSLYQDIETQIPQSLVHKNWSIYDENIHSVELKRDGYLHCLYKNLKHEVNSIHHQAIKKLSPQMNVEAQAEDGVIEAVKYMGDTYIVGVQWHPEFQTPQQSQLISPTPLLQDFLNHVRVRKSS